MSIRQIERTRISSHADDESRRCSLPHTAGRMTLADRTSIGKSAILCRLSAAPASRSLRGPHGLATTGAGIRDADKFIVGARPDRPDSGRELRLALR